MKIISASPYDVQVLDSGRIKVGCEEHTLEEWTSDHVYCTYTTFVFGKEYTEISYDQFLAYRRIFAELKEEREQVKPDDLSQWIGPLEDAIKKNAYGYQEDCPLCHKTAEIKQATIFSLHPAKNPTSCSKCIWYIFAHTSCTLDMQKITGLTHCFEEIDQTRSRLREILAWVKEQVRENPTPNSVDPRVWEKHSPEKWLEILEWFEKFPFEPDPYTKSLPCQYLQLPCENCALGSFQFHGIANAKCKNRIPQARALCEQELERRRGPHMKNITPVGTATCSVCNYPAIMIADLYCCKCGVKFQEVK